MMTGIAAASFFSNACRFGGCGLHFPSLAELIEHIEDNHIGECPCPDPHVGGGAAAASPPPPLAGRSCRAAR